MRPGIRKFLNTAPIEHLKYIRNRYRKRSAKRIIKRYLKTSPRPMLNIGCGQNVIAGWLNTDFSPSKSFKGQIAFLDAGVKFPFEDNTFDAIYSEHLFEHLTFDQAANMLSECHRILKKNGVLRLAIPHAEFLFALYQDPDLSKNKRYIDFSMHYFCKEIDSELSTTNHANIYVINNFYRDWGHQMMHTFESLKELLEHFKFTKIQKPSVGHSEHDYFIGLERQGRLMYPAEYYDLETMVVESSK